MDVTLEQGRLVIAPSSREEAEALAEWHEQYTSSAKTSVIFRDVEEQRAGTALILSA